jgi:hypothetical protein
MKRTISKITVNAGGLKGLILEGREDVAKNNKITEDGFKLTKKHPISRDLEDKLKEFRFFALNICGLITDSTTKNEKLMLLDGCDVLSIEFEKGVTGYFKIKVASRVFDTKTITLSTPKTDSSDDYEYFDTVMNVVESLLEEVEQYEKGLKQISDEDLMISYISHGKDKSMDLDKLNEMSAEEKADYCQSILEKLGCLVIRPDEVYEEGEIEEVSLETNVQPLMLDMDPMSDESQEVWEATMPQEDEIEPLELKIAEPIKLKK